MSPDTIPSFLTGDGEMAGHILGFDWSNTPLGRLPVWPPGLQSAVRLMLGSGHPMLIWWGEHRIQLYNDAHVPSLTPGRHPVSLGQRGAEAWPEAWDVISPQIERILAGGPGSWHEDQPVSVLRGGRLETARWTYSLTPIDDLDSPGGIGGVLLISQGKIETVKALQDANERLAARIAEQAKAELTRNRLSAIFDTSQHLMGLLNVEGEVWEANPASLKILGVALADVRGKKLWDCPWFTGTPGMPGQVQADISRAAAGETIRREISIALPSGLRLFDFSLRPARDAEGKIFAIMPEALDITHSRAAEERLRQAQKMEAVGQLSGGLAHDFNNLLTGISGSLDLLNTRIAQGRAAEAGRYITAAQTSATRAAALTHRLLAFSRRQTLDSKPVQPNTLIAGMEGQIRSDIGPEIQLRTRLAEDLWDILCDARQLENAILNLCLNARDAMPDGGTLTVETANVMLDERQARARDMLPGPYAGIFVTDTGIGMNSEVASRAFDPFYTTKPIGLGTGLGLSMIYGFTQQSGGQVRIHSTEGMGTTMRLFLPRYATGESISQPSSEPARFAALEKTGATALVVDDEPAVRMLVVEVLEELGLKTLEAAEGASGLKILQSGAQIDVLITDVGLPGGMNGRQMADAARQHRPGLKVLFITGYAETAVVGNGSLEHGMEVMTKPFQLDHLAARVQALLET